MLTLLVVLAIYGVMSLVAFAAMALDKRAARRGLSRIPEKTLHALELAAGWPGSLLASKLLRHKSVKPSYRVTRWAIIALHALAWAAWLVWRFARAG